MTAAGRTRSSCVRGSATRPVRPCSRRTSAAASSARCSRAAARLPSAVLQRASSGRGDASRRRRRCDLSRGIVDRSATRAPSPSISGARSRLPLQARAADRRRRAREHAARRAAAAPRHRPVRDRELRRQARRRPARAEPALPRLVGRRPAGRLPRRDRRAIRLHGRGAVRAVERGAADVTADGPDQTWPPALTSTLRTRYSSRLYHAAADRHVAALAEHEAAAVRRRPRPAGAQLRRRPQPLDRARRRSRRRAGGLPGAAAEHATATGATARYTLDPEPRRDLSTGPTWPRRDGSSRHRARRGSR